MSQTYPPTEDEIAAALAAVRLMLQADTEPEPDRPGWHASARLVVQHIHSPRAGMRPSWNTIERLRRHPAGSFLGVTGL